jgi:hypothetical protein
MELLKTPVEWGPWALVGSNTAGTKPNVEAKNDYVNVDGAQVLSAAL